MTEPIKFALENLADARLAGFSDFLEQILGGTPGAPLIDDMQDHMDLVNADGKLRLFTARQAGRLVGCATLILYRDARAPGVLAAVQDNGWLDPELASQQFLELVKFSDTVLASEGVHEVHRQFPVGDRVVPRLYEAGYLHALITVVKKLGGGSHG